VTGAGPGATAAGSDGDRESEPAAGSR
jgi:hypothetical protein